MATQNKSKRFSPKVNIRKGDKVIVISGDDKGKTGEVLRVFPDKNRAIVEGVNMAKKHVKATQNEEGGIQDMEKTIDISNLSLVDPTSGGATRVGYRMENDVKVRYSIKSGNIIK